MNESRFSLRMGAETQRLVRDPGSYRGLPVVVPACWEETLSESPMASGQAAWHIGEVIGGSGR